MGEDYELNRVQIATVLDDCLYNIISDTVLKVHREEKIRRMQTAAIIAQQREDESTSNTEEKTSPHQPAALVGDDGKIYLQGNPLKTTNKILCPTCKLPQLLYPTTGLGSRPPPDPSKEYCTRVPYINKEGHDIHGQSLNFDSKPTKKTKATSGKNTKDSNSNAKSTVPTTSPSASNESESPAAAGSSNNNKSSQDTVAPTTSIPSAKCPNCPRYMALTRIAQHLDRCIGLSGRQAGMNAMTKMNANTPRESRATTPNPNANLAAIKKRKLEKETRDETPEGTPKKKKKTVQKKTVEKERKEGKEKVKLADKPSSQPEDDEKGHV
ncbi:hypothetical protein MMC09_001893 [Bachmanniomyces sp. S44760]|nr:hypothetical protein [Bachmanniomyces sp. S44760]